MQVEPAKDCGFCFGVKQIEPVPVASRRGLTLLEVLITLVILAVGMTALTSAFSRGIYASTDAADLGTAGALAQTKVEELRDTAFASIADETRAAISGFTGFDREVAVTSSPGTTDANFKQVDVTVYWGMKGGEVSTVLTSYFVND